MELFENEEFVPIKGFENYEISRSGKVRNRKRGRMLKGSVNSRGYFYVALFDGGLAKAMTVHRLVALHFISNPQNYSEVNHKDGNKLNNSIDNLEWCTREENIRHSWEIGLRKHINFRGEKNGRSKLTEKQVIEIKGKLKQGLRICDIARNYSIHKSTIKSIKRGKNWSHVTI